jgi:uncharacterized membrane protein
MNTQIGRVLIIIGIILIIFGVIFLLAANKPSLLSWFGRLPGDIRVDKGRTKFFFPLTTMVILIIVLTLLINLIRKLF